MLLRFTIPTKVEHFVIRAMIIFSPYLEYQKALLPNSLKVYRVQYTVS